MRIAYKLQIKEFRLLVFVRFNYSHVYSTSWKFLILKSIQFYKLKQFCHYSCKPTTINWNKKKTVKSSCSIIKK